MANYSFTTKIDSYGNVLLVGGISNKTTVENSSAVVAISRPGRADSKTALTKSSSS